jgi:putative ABC transport system ATP-binding protein
VWRRGEGSPSRCSRPWIEAYAQQALLWEAAGRLRERVFARLLERDLAFFEGRGGVAAGDLAHRTADEADDVADAVFSVLNVRLNSSLVFVVLLPIDSL